VRTCFALHHNQQHPLINESCIDSYGEPRDWLPKPEWLAWLANRTSTRIVFAEANFSEYYATAPHSAETPGHIEGYGRGYRDMCRFFGGMISEHPVMQEFDYYIRMDSDSEFKKEVRYDIREEEKRKAPL